MVDRADRDCVQIFLEQQLAKVFILATAFADFVGRFLAAASVDVADRDELDAPLLLGRFHDALALAADANRRHHDPVVGAKLLDLSRGGVALFRVRENFSGIPEWQSRQRQRGQRAIQKSPSRHRSAFIGHRQSPQVRSDTIRALC